MGHGEREADAPQSVFTFDSFFRFLLPVFLTRFTRDTGVRMFYPFLPQIAGGLGISLTTAGALLTVRTLLTVLAPIFGHRAGQVGPRKVLRWGFLLQASGLTILSIAHGIAVALLAVFLLGISDAIILPLTQTYVGEHSPKAQRGRALATVEYSWALTGIAILPIVGWLMSSRGWWVPLRLLALAGALSFLLVSFVFPPDPPRRNEDGSRLFAQMKQVWKDPSTAHALIANAFLYVAFESVAVVYGAHLERDFHLDAAQVGQIASLLGFAELTGSFTSSMVVDRLRPRRTLLFGLVGLMLGLGMVTFLRGSLLLFTAGLVVLFVLMEYSLVSLIPLLSEQQPGRRATVLATAPMLASVARSATDSWSARLFVTRGFSAVGGFALLSVAVGASLVWRGVEER